MNEHDPRAMFQQDQEEAANQATEREAIQWANMLEGHNVNVDQARAVSEYHRARASAFNSGASLLASLGVLVLVTAARRALGRRW